MIEFPLTAEQKDIYNLQLAEPDTIMFNALPLLMKLHDRVDIDRLIQSIMKDIHAHPAYLTVIEERRGQPVQRYIPDLITSIPVERISEAELMSIKDDLIQPFSFDGEALCRFRIFITEKNKYLFWDDHHIIADGIGKYVFEHDLQNIYDGQDAAPDSWFRYLKERADEKFSPHYAESFKWYEEHYGHCDYCGRPEPDFDAQDGVHNKQGLLRVSAELTENDLDVLRRFNTTRTEFFNAVLLLAVAEYNHDPRVLITWIYKGRWKKWHHRILGLMIQDLPLFVNVRGLTLSEILASVREQTKGCLAHRDCPYTSLEETTVESDKQVCAMYNRKLMTTDKMIPLSADFIDIEKKNAASEGILDVEIWDTDSETDFVFDYNASRYKLQTMQKFAELCVRILHDSLRRMNSYA